MFPTLISGQSVQVEVVDHDCLKPGDILLTLSHGRYRLHRLLRNIEAGQYQSGGDFCRRADSFHSCSHIVGRMIQPSSGLIEKWAKRFTLWRFNL